MLGTGGVLERRGSGTIAGIEFGAVGQQHFDHLDMPVPGGGVQRRGSRLGIAGIYRHALFDQQRRRPGEPFFRRIVESGRARMVTRMDVGAIRQQ